MTSASHICLMIAVMGCAFAAFAAPEAVETHKLDNMYLSGSNIKVDSPVPADLLAAGGKIRIEQNIGADAALAGGSIDVDATVGQDLRVAAGTLDIAGNVGGELVAAGGTVKLDKTAVVAGPAWLTGGNVTVAGRIAKGAKIAANTFTLSGQIDGDTRLYAQQINFLPGAKINGRLFYASPTPLDQEQAAHVLGTITREPFPEARNAKIREARSISWFLPAFLLSMGLTGALLYRLFPHAIVDVQQTIRQYPLRSLFAGLALLFTIPPVAMLLIATVIGIPVGLALFLMYPLMLLLGYMAAAFFIGRRAADMLKQPLQLSYLRQMMFLFLALIILILLALIPGAGILIVAVALVTGIGGWAVSLSMRRSTRQETALEY